MKRVRGIILLYLCHLSLKWHSSFFGKRNLLGPYCLPWAKLSECLASQPVWDVAREAHFGFVSSRKQRCATQLEGRVGLGGQQPGLWEGIIGTLVRANQFADSNQEAHPWAPGDISSVGHSSQHKGSSCAPHASSYNSLPLGWHPVCAPSGSKCQPLQMTDWSTCTESSPTVWDWVKTQPLEHHPRESKWEAVST